MSSTSHLKRKYIEECEEEDAKKKSPKEIEYELKSKAISLIELLKENTIELEKLPQRASASIKRKRG